MNRQITTQGMRLARRHPRGVLRVGLFAGQHLGTTVKIAEAGRRASQLGQPVRRAATDRKVHAEARRAAQDASRAARRAQRVGLTGAHADRRVGRHLRRAAEHASKAASLAVHPRRHRIRNATIVAVGTGLLAGAAYGGWRKCTTPTESWDAPDLVDTAGVDHEESGAAGSDAAGETTGEA